jgi:hypothetical protein
MVSFASRLGLLAAMGVGLVSGCSFFGISTAPSDPSASAAPTGAAPATAPPETSLAAAPASEPAPSSEAAAPEPVRPVSVTIRNTCSETVKLFFGDKPKFGSGRYSSIGSNTSTSHSFMPGDMLWIVDDSQEGLSSVTVAEGMRSIEVQGSCTDLRSA